MLKGKKAIYVLVPLNIAIWSFFIYRFYSAYHDGDIPEIETQVSVVKPIIESDTSVYVLNLQYDDPFLKGIVSKKPILAKKENKANVKTPSVVKIVKEPVKVAIPEIKYLGLVKNNTTGLATAIVSINGQSRIVKQNELLEGIQIKSFDSNELIAYFGKEKVTIKK